MNVLSILLIGFVVGLIARAVKPGNDRMGLLATTLFGIGGALIAKYLGLAMGWYHDGDALSFVAAIVGAMILLTLFALLHHRKR